MEKYIVRTVRETVYTVEMVDKTAKNFATVCVKANSEKAAMRYAAESNPGCVALNVSGKTESVKRYRMTVARFVQNAEPVDGAADND